MSFESLLDAATELLKRRRRITYRALKREFGIDDETLADLRDELIIGQRVARDDGGLVLEWVAAAPQAAERRWLTVMFCDLVGSTKLSTRLDPEDLRDIVRGYHEQCAAVLQPLGGYIAQYLGDGILVYFGYPVANEDDAERAVHAGLMVVQAVGQFSERFAATPVGGLQVRVGIHTGRVVVGDLGDSSNPETLALGEAPNIAAHIQSVAGPGQVLISDATYALLPAAAFATDDLGAVVLKDPAKPVHLHRVLADRAAVGPGASLPPRQRLVDPGGCLDRLLTLWRSVRDGAGRLMVLRGEAGLGKSRLAAELCDRVLAQGDRVRVLRCSAFHRHSALHPIAQHLLQRAGVNADAPGDDVQQRLHETLRQDGIDRPDAPELLRTLVGREAADATTSAAQRMQALQELLFRWLSASAAQGPALLLVEDLHWADPSTLAVLRRFVPASLPAGLLVLATARNELALPWEPGDGVELLDLQRMDDASVRGLVMALPGGPALSVATVERIVQLAEGVPLFAEQIARSVIDPSTRTPEVDVPASLGASLMARLDRLAGAKTIAQTAALLGREFSVDLLSAVCELPGSGIQAALGQLVSGGVLQAVEGGGPPRFAFCHALLQSAAAESMLRQTRQGRHLRIAQVLQRQFSGLVETEPETLARHLTGAGPPCVMQAAAQWRAAGEHALARSAVLEGLSHLQQGMGLLHDIAPGPERDELELGLQVAMASALRAVQGVASRDTGAACERAVELARKLGDRQRLIPALNGLYSYHLVGARFESARGPAQQLLDVARESHDRLFEMIGHRAVGAVLLHTGELGAARRHLEQGLSMYEPALHAPLAPQLGIDHRVMSSNFLGMALVLLGEDEAGRAQLGQALDWARQIDHAHSLAQALAFHCIVAALQERWAEMPEMARQTIAIGRERGFVLMEVCGSFFLLASQALLGGREAAEQALPEMVATLDRWWQTGATNYQPLCQALLARVQALTGRLDAASETLALAHRQVAESGERLFESGLWRVQAQLLPEGRQDAAQRALAVALAQGAVGLERRVRVLEL